MACASPSRTVSSMNGSGLARWQSGEQVHKGSVGPECCWRCMRVRLCQRSLVNSVWRDAFLPIAPTDVGNGGFQINGARKQADQGLRTEPQSDFLETSFHPKGFNNLTTVGVSQRFERQLTFLKRPVKERVEALLPVVLEQVFRLFSASVAVRAKRGTRSNLIRNAYITSE